MSNHTTEDIIGTLYDYVQDARSMPLASDKCILERDKVLDMLDEIIAQLPAEIKQSRTIVESRNELISQARKEAEGILRQAQEKAAELVAQEEIYKQAQQACEELVARTQSRIDQIKQVGNEYMDDALRRTEETMTQALMEVQQTRLRFKTVTETQDNRRAVPNVDIDM